MAPGAATGRCTDIKGCGRIENHAIVETWECGAAGCPDCAVGGCVNHKCMEGVVSAPTNAFVGDNPIVHAEADGKACANCEILVTDPTGGRFSIITDEDGNAEIPLKTVGPYTVALTKEDAVLRTVTIKALVRPSIEIPGMPTGVLSEQAVPIVVLLLLLAAFVIFYLRSRRKK